MALADDLDRHQGWLMKIKLDDWLSSMFGYDAFRITLNHDTTSPSPEKIFSLSKSSSAFFYIKIPTRAVKQVASFTNIGFHVIDVSITYERLSKNSKKTISQTSPEIIIAEAQPNDQKRILEISSKCFIFSRFHLDPYIPVTLANKIKREWVTNYFRKERGDRLLVAKLQDRPVGFLAVMNQNTTNGKIRVIDLIGVSPIHQQMGIGKALVQFFINDSLPTYDVLKVGTQVANIPSMRLYESFNFVVSDAAYTLHAHIRNRKVLK